MLQFQPRCALGALQGCIAEVALSSKTCQSEQICGVQALISVGATGVSVAPQGLNIAPALIAVTPGRVSVNPQGGTISPAGISVSASDKPAPKPAKPGQGRRLQQTIFEDIAHTVDNMKANAQAAAGQLQGNPSTSTTAAQPASTEACSAPCLLLMWHRLYIALL